VLQTSVPEPILVAEFLPTTYVHVQEAVLHQLKELNLAVLLLNLEALLHLVKELLECPTAELSPKPAAAVLHPETVKLSSQRHYVNLKSAPTIATASADGTRNAALPPLQQLRTVVNTITINSDALHCQDALGNVQLEPAITQEYVNVEMCAHKSARKKIASKLPATLTERGVSGTTFRLFAHVVMVMVSQH